MHNNEAAPLKSYECSIHQFNTEPFSAANLFFSPISHNFNKTLWILLELIHPKMMLNYLDRNASLLKIFSIQNSNILPHFTYTVLMKYAFY